MSATSRRLTAFVFAACFISLTSHRARAWGHTGHAVVGTIAAYLLSHETPTGPFLKAHAYDLSYYANVPDVIWKSTPEMYRMEGIQHYVDLEIFQRNMGTNPQWLEDRHAFQKKYPQVPRRAGWAFWRIQEFNKRLTKITARLRKVKDRKERRNLQKKWLLTAGLMGHYYGDLAQPLHCTENHDGELTGQKGVHYFFEEVAVNDLYPEVLTEAYHRAQKQWPAFKKQVTKKSAFEVAHDLCKDSLQQVPKLLAIDKKVGRKDIAKAAAAYHNMIVERLAKGGMALAAIWSRHLGWQYDDNRFFYFGSHPQYIKPPTYIGKANDERKPAHKVLRTRRLHAKKAQSH